MLRRPLWWRGVGKVALDGANSRAAVDHERAHQPLGVALGRAVVCSAAPLAWRGRASELAPSSVLRWRGAAAFAPAELPWGAAQRGCAAAAFSARRGVAHVARPGAAGAVGSTGPARVAVGRTGRARPSGAPAEHTAQAVDSITPVHVDRARGGHPSSHGGPPPGEARR